MTYKILDPSNPDDRRNFFEILESYMNSTDRFYPESDKQARCDRYKDKFNNLPRKDFIVCGKFEDDKLVKFLACQSVSSKVNKEDLLPFWSFDLLYGTKTWNLKNSEEVDNLTRLGAYHFLDQGYTKGYQFTRLPARIYKTEDIKHYLKTDFLKTYPSDILYPQLEEIFLTQKDIDNYKFKILRPLLSDHILQPFVLISWNLQPELIFERRISCK